MIQVVDSKDTFNLKRLSDLTWIYIGGYKGIERACKILKESNRRFIAKDIEEIADSVRENFIDFIGKISSQQTNKALWYSSRMASKSISQTSIFHQYIYLKLIERLSEKVDRDILVVTDDEELLENVRKIQPNGIKPIKNRLFYKKYAYERFRGYLRISRYLLFWLICRFLKNKRSRDFNVFIQTWIDNRTFSNLPHFTDSFFCDLGNFFTEKGYSVGRLTPIRMSLKHLFKIKKYFSNIIYPLSYLTFSDLIRCIFSNFICTIDSNGLTKIKDLKILYTLAKNETKKENRTKIFKLYLLLFYSYKNLSFKINDDASFIYPFENQPWEKMFNLAFAKHRMVAYMHSTIPYNWLDYWVSQYDDELFPKLILTTGKVWSSFLKKHYTNSVIAEAGALRYPYLFNGRQKISLSRNPKSIIVALPISPTISISLQRLLLNSLKEKDSIKGYTIKIKPHPYLPKAASLKGDFSSFKNVEFVSNGIDSLLKDCILLITTGSTVAFESLFLGIKTLYFIPEELSLGLEYFIRDDLFIAYEENFLNKLEEALESSKYPGVDIEKYFSQPDYRIFLRYLQTTTVN